MHLEAENILRAFRGGSSLPVLVETTRGTRCVVKWKGAGDGPLASAADWIGLHLAQLAGIPVPTPHLIRITPALASAQQDPEINDLVERSLGINLAVEFLNGALPYQPAQSRLIDSELKRRIYCLDVLLLNIDRTDFNPNILFHENRFVCHDFASALEIKTAMNDERYAESALLKVIRRHPFYSPMAKGPIPDFPVKSSDVNEIIHSLPDEWLPDSASMKKKLVNHSTTLFTERQPVLERRLALLDGIPLESIEARNARLLRNKRAFESTVNHSG